MVMDWFMVDFGNFIRDLENKTIEKDPAFQFSYKLNNKSKFIFPSNDSPITYRINSNEVDENDLYFINNLNKKLTETSYYNLSPNDTHFNFNLKLMSDSWMHENPETLLYVQAGLNRDFYEKNKSSKEISSVIDNLAKSILLGGLKEERKPHEVVFSYDFLGLLPSPQIADKHLRWGELENFLKYIKK